MGIVHFVPVNSWDNESGITHQAVLIGDEAISTSWWMGAQTTERTTSKGIHFACTERSTFIFITNTCGIAVQILDRPSWLELLGWDKLARYVHSDLFGNFVAIS